MTQMNRRMILGGAAAVGVIGGAVVAWQMGLIPGGALSSASGLAAGGSNVDLSGVNKPHPLGEKVLGSADAPVTIIEYASATCPHCADFHRLTLPAIKKEYVDTGKVKFIFREFPFDDLALAAFMITRCASPEQYFPLMDILFEQQAQWAGAKDKKAALFAIAREAGFTEESFNACLSNEAIAKGIIEGRDFAAKDLGIDSTPSFFINGKLVKGALPIADFRKEIDAALGA